MTSNEQTKKYLELLFDPTDLRAFKGPDVWNRPTAAPTDTSEFVVLNPVRHHRDAKMETIATYRNILIEFDGMPLKKQRELVKKLNLPWTTCTFSGSGSYHYVISMEEPFISLEEYKDTVNLIHAIVRYADVKCKNANRLTRLAGAKRADRDGALQELIAVKPRVTTMQLEGFFYQFPKICNAYYLDKLNIIRDPLAPEGGAQDTELSDRAKAVIERGETFGKSRHDALMEVILNARGCGYDEVQAYEVASQAAVALGIADRNDLPGLMAWAYGTKMTR